MAWGPWWGLILLAIIFMLWLSSPSSTQLNGTTLQKEGWTVYGVSTCKFCTLQKGKIKNYEKVYHECNSCNHPLHPIWVNANGKVVKGSIDSTRDLV